MSVYQNGSTVFVDFTFYVLTDPTKHNPVWPSDYAPSDPTTTTFYVRSPDNDLLTFVFATDTEVTNPSVGRYLLELDASVLDISNLWTYRVQGTGAVEAAAEGEFDILPSQVLEPFVSEPGFAPCQNWCDVQDVAERCSGSSAGSDWTKYEAAVQAASQILFRLSGGQYTGICRQTVRPFNDGCGCWSWITSPASPGVPQWPVGFGFGAWGGLGWGWGYGGCNSVLGCGPVSRVLLPGYPVTSVVSVNVAGTVLGASEYRLDGWRWLTRMDDSDGNPQFWPGCQDLSREIGEPGTWAVSVTSGQAPPVAGQLAATELACEIFRAMEGGECKLPQGATQAIRQGITIQMAPFRAWGQINGQWATGLYMVDAFLSSFNPAALKRRPSVWSPDIEPFAAKLGTGSGS